MKQEEILELAWAGLTARIAKEARRPAPQASELSKLRRKLEELRREINRK
jgi:hypothetical protein